MTQKGTWLRIILLMIGLYHIGLGGMGFLSADAAGAIARDLFGMNLDVTPQMAYIAKLLGIYSLIFGVFVMTIAREPQRYRGLMNIIVLLYALRVMNKLLFMDQFQTAFGATMSRVWLDATLLAFFGLSVFFLRPRSTDTPPAALQS